MKTWEGKIMKIMLSKTFFFAVIVLFIGAGFVPSISSDVTSLGAGNTLHVGGSGAGNYTTIQSAIDDANAGDTVFVYNGTYHENILIRKSISLIGEDRKNTFIIGDSLKENVVRVEAGSVLINNFTIKNSDNGIYVGVEDSTNIIISNNIIVDNSDAGIKFFYSSQNAIIKNNISHNNYGIDCNGFWDSVVSYNNINNNNDVGIVFGKNETIEWHHINNNDVGIEFNSSILAGTFNNTISYNNICNNIRGVRLYVTHMNYFNHNNFISNIILDATFGWEFYDNWNYNYWDRPRFLPKPIFGYAPGFIPWVMFDWHPAQEPYDIPAIN